ncbi:hypothetical protein [Streptomyces canus]|uniref:hypothetical protein n=1 Tax=Streptomyces canus TaxID=58343 RepID=UPI003CECD6C9
MVVEAAFGSAAWGVEEGASSFRKIAVQQAHGHEHGFGCGPSVGDGSSCKEAWIWARQTVFAGRFTVTASWRATVRVTLRS